MNKTADNPSTKSEHREKAYAQIEKKNNSPGSSTSSGSSSGYGSPPNLPENSKSSHRKKNPRAAKAMKPSESNTSSGAGSPSVGFYGADNSQWIQ
ncbi:unnamed protein product [Caenorhabditis brenneri]